MEKLYNNDETDSEIYKTLKLEPFENITVSATEVAGLIGGSEYKTQYKSIMELKNKKNQKEFDPNFIDVWNSSKTIDDKIKNISNPLIKQGILVEDLIRKTFEDASEHKILETQKAFRSGLLTCIVDGIGIDEDGNRSIYEFKHSNDIQSYEDIPNDYKIQCYINMILSGIFNCYLVVSNLNTYTLTFKISFNPKIFSRIDSYLFDVYTTYIIDGNTPQMGESDLAEYYNDPTKLKNTNLNLNGVFDDSIIDELNEIKKNIEKLTKRKHEIEDKIKSAIGFNKSITTSKYIIEWRPSMRVYIDRDLLKMLYPDVYKDVKKENKLRVLKIYKKRFEN